MKNPIEQSYQRIKPYIHRTPVITSTFLDNMAGCEIYFKCENFQRMGAFKMRGASNAIILLSDDQRKRGVATHSSGNFAQAVSLAARELGTTAYVVMPEDAPAVKKEAVRGYGGIVIESSSDISSRDEMAAGLVAEKGLTFLHPSNDINVILGQGTAAYELIADIPGLDYILTPVGGGGLVAGTILATRETSPHTKIIGCEPAAASDAFRSLESGRIEANESCQTIADGLRTQLGDVNFPIIREGIDKIVLIEEDEIIAAMRLIWERMKIVVEPSAAVAFAGVLKERGALRGKRVGVILSGGNVDLSALPF